MAENSTLQSTTDCFLVYGLFTNEFMSGLVNNQTEAFQLESTRICRVNLSAVGSKI